MFWDTDPKKIDPRKHAKYIIERVADFGHDDEVKWVWDFYDKDFLRKVINDSRSLRPRTKTLWLSLLNQ